MKSYENKICKKEKIRDNIIAHAAKVFNKLGYKKTTMDDIAGGIQKGKSSIYYYFKSKEEIYQAVVLKEAVGFRRTIINAINEQVDPESKLKAYILTRMNTINVYKNFHCALKNEKLRQLEFIRRLNALYDMEEIRLFKNILKEGVVKHFFRIRDIELASIAIVMAMKGIESSLLRVENPKVFVFKIDDLIKIILFGIVKR